MPEADDPYGPTAPAMAATAQDRSAAVAIAVTLSGQLSTAVLAMIAVWGALATYIFDKRSPSGLFYVLYFGVFLIFVLSVYKGGRGVSKTCGAGFHGKWSLEVGKRCFGQQAFFALLGLVLLVISLLFIGAPKEDTTEAAIQELRKQAAETNEVIRHLTDRVGVIESKP